MTEVTGSLQAQISLLRQYQSRQVNFPDQIRKALDTCADAEAAVSQAKRALEDAKAAAAEAALLDPAKADHLTSEVKRKAIAEAGVAKCELVKAAHKSLVEATRKLASANNDHDQVKNQRRSIEYAQTAALGIVTAYQIIKGDQNVSSCTRVQPNLFSQSR